MSNICMHFDKFGRGNCETASYVSTMCCLVVSDAIHINCSCENKDLSVECVEDHAGLVFNIMISIICTNQLM